jgi:hypothetical protein
MRAFCLLGWRRAGELLPDLLPGRVGASLELCQPHRVGGAAVGAAPQR